MILSDDELNELKRLAKDASLTSDLRHLMRHRYNPLLIDKQVCISRLFDFLNDFNEFINHRPKPFKPIIDKDMRL